MAEQTDKESCFEVIVYYNGNKIENHYYVTLYTRPVVTSSVTKLSQLLFHLWRSRYKFIKIASW